MMGCSEKIENNLGWLAFWPDFTLSNWTVSMSWMCLLYNTLKSRFALTVERIFLEGCHARATANLKPTPHKLICRTGTLRDNIRCLLSFRAPVLLLHGPRGEDSRQVLDNLGALDER
jgi:hypothetical protein